MSSGKYQYCLANSGAAVLKKIRTDAYLSADIKALDDAALFTWFAGHDPSAQDARKPYSYLQWLCTQFIKQDNFKAHDLVKIQSALVLFDRHKVELLKTDINRYEPSDLLAAVSIYQVQSNVPVDLNDNVLADLQTSTIYKGVSGSIMIPHTQFAADKMSAKCGWCIHSEKGDAFSTYNQDGPIFQILAHDPTDQKQRRYLTHANNAMEDRWGKPAKPSDWFLIQAVLEEALAAGAITVGALVVAAGIPPSKIPNINRYMTQEDAFDLALFKPASIRYIPAKLLTSDVCAAMIARDPDRLSSLPVSKRTLSLKMLAAAVRNVPFDRNSSMALQYITGKFETGGAEISEWYAAYSVSVYPHMFRDVANKNKSLRLKSIALTQDKNSLNTQLVSMNDAEKPLLYLSAIPNDASVISVVPTAIATEAFLTCAIRMNPDVFKNLKHEQKQPEICMVYAEKTGIGHDEASKKFVELIKAHSPTGKLADMDLSAAQASVLEAMEKESDAYKWLPKRLRNYEIYRAALEKAAEYPSNDVPEGIAPAEIFTIYPELLMPQSLHLLPDSVRSADLCLQALAHHSFHAHHIPEAILADRDFLKKAIPLQPDIASEIEEKNMDAELIDLALQQSEVSRGLFWRIPDHLWNDRYADEAAKKGLSTVVESVPKRLRTYERVKTACAAKDGLYMHDLHWGKVPQKFWTDELVDIVLRQVPTALSMVIANEKKPVIPRKFLQSKERMIALGREFVALKVARAENNEKPDYGLPCPGDYFATSGLFFDRDQEHPFNVAPYFAPHIQDIDPKGYMRETVSMRARIQEWEKGVGKGRFFTEYAFFSSVLNHYDHPKTPAAYLDTEMALLLLREGVRLQGKCGGEFRGDLKHFVENFAPSVFNQEVFDLCCRFDPVFFLVRQGLRWDNTYAINPDYKAFVKAHHIEHAKANDQHGITKNLIGPMPTAKVKSLKPSAP